jgi:hypothetical protein
MELLGKGRPGMPRFQRQHGTGAKTWPQSSCPRLCAAFRGGSSRWCEVGGYPFRRHLGEMFDVVQCLPYCFNSDSASRSTRGIGYADQDTDR